MIYLTQILFALYAYFNAKEEAAWSWPYRNISFSNYDKERELDAAHDSGGARVVMAMIIGSTPYLYLETGLFDKTLWFIISMFISGISYWLVFDPVIAKNIGKNWDYIGDTADADNFLIKHLGKNAGQIKAILCAAIILTFNILYFILC